MSRASSAGPPSTLSIDPVTQRHLLSIPSIFQSVSPTVAAVHLAHARLLLSVSAHEQLFDGWCHACGGLREGLGGTAKKRRKGAGINQAQRKAGRCTICGASFRRSRPDPISKNRFPSARIARRNQQASSIDPTGPEAITIGTDTPIAGVLDPVRIPIPPSSPPGLSRATVFHVLSTPPTPPTYPQPAPLVPLEKKGTRKKKKSGLAKLLAENKERKERDQAGGSWGLR